MAPLYTMAALGCTLWEGPHAGPVPAGHIDDASRLNQTQVAEVWPVPKDPVQAEKQVRQLLARARSASQRVSIAGAKHSMGGHTFYPGGVVIDTLGLNHMRLDPATGVLTVGAGARWSNILEYLHPRGRSVAVMQSNHDFTVGGSISVNCHGWQHDRPPIASTVQSFRLMKADGQVVRCSRTENKSLFSLVLGGYGLFGVILDVNLQTVPNEAYTLKRHLVAGRDYGRAFKEHVHAEARMAFGRLSVTPGRLFEQAILYVLTPAPPEAEPPVDLKAPAHRWLRRSVFRGSVGSAVGKAIRWELEKSIGETAGSDLFWRNHLLYKPVSDYANRSAWTTDILHEYFVPVDRFDAFLDRTRAVVGRHPVDLLNVTVRTLEADPDTVLRYADQKMFALVMLFNQPRTESGEAQMAQATEALIEAVLAEGGRYYLPYRLHASKSQFHKAYPMARSFFESKRRHDPDELFFNHFYARYGVR